MIARVSLELALRKEFDYLIPPALVDRVDVGSRVQVPFGPRKVLGCVTALAEESAHARLKPILKVIGAQTLVTPKVLKLARWIGEYYCCAPEIALKSVLPEAVRKEQSGWRERLFVRALPFTGELPKLPKRQREIWNIIEERRELPLQELLELAETTATPIRRLEDKGLVAITPQVSERDPYAHEHILPTQPLPLNPAQAAALEKIKAAMDKERGAWCVIRENGIAPAGDSSRITHGPARRCHRQHAECRRQSAQLHFSLQPSAFGLSLARRHRQRQDRGLSPGHCARFGAGQGRDCAGAGDFADAADGRAVQGAFQLRPVADARGRAAFAPVRRRAARRMAQNPPGPCPDCHRRALGHLRAR
jgi:hypothetical protein